MVASNPTTLSDTFIGDNPTTVSQFADVTFAIQPFSLESQTSSFVVATAKVNGATSSSTSLNVDNKSGAVTNSIAVGDFVSGTGVTEGTTVSAVGSQDATSASLTLSVAQSLGDNVDLTFSDAELGNTNVVSVTIFF